jgi:hypothetical protein
MQPLSSRNCRSWTCVSNSPRCRCAVYISLSAIARAAHNCISHPTNNHQVVVRLPRHNEHQCTPRHPTPKHPIPLLHQLYTNNPRAILQNYFLLDLKHVYQKIGNMLWFLYFFYLLTYASPRMTILCQCCIQLIVRLLQFTKFPLWCPWNASKL